jgi:hypothetical protein
MEGIINNFFFLTKNPWIFEKNLKSEILVKQSPLSFGDGKVEKHVD